MNNSYTKRPKDALAVEFDFTAFAQANGPATYLLKAEPGITVAATVASPDVMHLLVTGGAIGRVYRFGFEARNDEGDSLVDMRILRIREPWDATGQDDTVKVDADGLWHSVRGGDVVLTDEHGNTLWVREPGQTVLVNGAGDILVNGDGAVLVN